MSKASNLDINKESNTQEFIDKTIKSPEMNHPNLDDDDCIHGGSNCFYHSDYALRKPSPVIQFTDQTKLTT
jgi:hypothetical protein